jgi:hypothetical protein
LTIFHEKDQKGRFLLIFDPFSQKYTQKSQKPLKTRKNVVFDPKSRGYSEKPQILRQKLKGFGGVLGGYRGSILSLFVDYYADFRVFQKSTVFRPRFEVSP